MNMNKLKRQFRHYFGMATLCGFIVAFSQSGTALASDKQLESQHRHTQRVLFEAAETAIRKGHIGRFKRLAKQLEDYPLHSYLLFKYYSRHLSQTPDPVIKGFLTANAGEPVAIRLQHRWLLNRARRGYWQTVVENYYPNNDKRLKCYYAESLFKTGHDERAAIILETIWYTSRSLPRNCDRPIKLWNQKGLLASDMVWQRIHLAMRHGRTRLARHLAVYLPKNERFWVAMWSKIRRTPDFLIKAHEHFPLEGRPPMMRWMISDGLVKLSRKEPILASQYWQQLSNEYKFNDEDRERVQRRLAIALMKENTNEAKEWLGKLQLEQVDDRLSTLHAMTAFRDQDWETAFDWIAKLTAKEQQQPKWAYWRGRALEAMGQLEEARGYYSLNTNDRSYYGFLASDRLGQPYRFEHRPLGFSDQQLAQLYQIPAIERAVELLALKRVADARREWRHATDRMDQNQLLMAAKFASRINWPDRAISTLATAKYWDDLELRFPLTHQQVVLKQAQKHNINPAWAFAVIRQESAFTADARSHAGALGLMQLMPRTARQMARKLKVRFPGRKGLLNINTNVRLGVGYLKRVSDRYEGHSVLATAAYNAGTSRVKKWMPETGSKIPADVWIEMVPFTETRKYLKRVLTYMVIYERRLGQAGGTLLDRMPPIGVDLTVAQKPAQQDTPG